MKQEELQKIVSQPTEDTQENVKPFEFEIDKKIKGALFLRSTGKAEFYPSVSREGKGGMTTTEKNGTFTIQEGAQKLKVTLSFPKVGLSFNELTRVLTKLVNHMQKNKLV